MPQQEQELKDLEMLYKKPHNLELQDFRVYYQFKLYLVVKMKIYKNN